MLLSNAGFVPKHVYVRQSALVGIQNPPGTKIADIERKMVELAREAHTKVKAGLFFAS